MAKKKTKKTGAVVVYSEGRDAFGCPADSGSHFICAALVELSGAAGAAVGLADIIVRAAALNGGEPTREPSGIINSLRLSKLVERAGRGAVKLTPAGWALWQSGKSSAHDGIKKTMLSIRAELKPADVKALPASAKPAAAPKTAKPAAAPKTAKPAKKPAKKPAATK